MTDTRTRLTADLKTAMLARDAERVSTLRMIQARIKDADIAARPGPPLEEAALTPVFRSMVKSRRESVELYRQGNRPELVAKEEAEIAVIEAYLPQAMDDAALAAAVDAAIAASGATGPKEMGKVMAALKAAHGAALDMGRAGPLVKAKLS